MLGGHTDANSDTDANSATNANGDTDTDSNADTDRNTDAITESVTGDHDGAVQSRDVFSD